jgi:hypothetical protein
MALDAATNKTISGDTEGPFIQFEDCPHKNEYLCKFIDNNGKCSFETCVIDNIEPPRVLIWYYTCLICNRQDSAKPEELRAPFCHSCVSRMQKVEVLPHSCRYCGKTVNNPPAFMFSGICDDCDNILKEMVNYYRAVGKWKPL